MKPNANVLDGSWPCFRKTKRVREVTRHVCEKIGVAIIKGVLSTDHMATRYSTSNERKYN